MWVNIIGPVSVKELIFETTEEIKRFDHMTSYVKTYFSTNIKDKVLLFLTYKGSI